MQTTPFSLLVKHYYAHLNIFKCKIKWFTLYKYKKTSFADTAFSGEITLSLLFNRPNIKPKNSIL